MNNNNNKISQSENRWQPKVSNPDIQNLYQKIQEAARDRDWVKIKEYTEEIEKLEKEIKVEEEREAEEEPTREELEKEFEEESNQICKGFKINRERYLELEELLGIIEKPKVEDQWITKPITLKELSETIQEESEIPQTEENVTTEEIK